MRKALVTLMVVICLLTPVMAGTNQTASKTLSINVVATLTIVTTTLPGAVAGAVYPTTQLQAAGGLTPYTWAVSTGPGQTGLPKGLALSTAGVLSGTVDPTACSGTNACQFTFTVTVTDSSGLLGQMIIKGAILPGL